MGIELNNMHAPKGAKHRRKILGRGRGSGHGASSTRGTKGQKSHSGEGPRLGFEGGQMSLIRLIPKRGFSNKSFANQCYLIVNLSQLETSFSANDEVNTETLLGKGLIRKKSPVKILGDGDLSKPLKVKVDAYSKSAKEKIVAVGGVAEIV